jgi:hypothetical protein
MVEGAIFMLHGTILTVEGTIFMLHKTIVMVEGTIFMVDGFGDLFYIQSM